MERGPGDQRTMHPYSSGSPVVEAAYIQILAPVRLYGSRVNRRWQAENARTDSDRSRQNTTF